MIRVKKSNDIPPKLKEEEEKYLGQLERGQNPEPHYNLPGVKSTLKRDFHKKCAYCESKIAHAQHGQIEHFKPKKDYPELALSWGNLLYGCSFCNVSKGAKFPVDDPILNPTEEDAEDFFFYTEIGGMIRIYPKDGDKRANNTIEITKLNRDDLAEYRYERVNELRDFLQDVLPEKKSRHISKCKCESFEFAGMFRSIF